MNDNFVYVMSDGVNYKIGVSKNPVQRATEVGRQYKTEISLLLSINCIDAFGCERYIHHKYQYLNVLGEWFGFPNREFLKDVWDVCTNNLIRNDAFISIDSKQKQRNSALDDLVDVCEAVTFDYIFKLLSDKDKYNQNTIPRMLQNMGCKKVLKTKSIFYITPKGLANGVDKKSKSFILDLVNNP